LSRMVLRSPSVTSWKRTPKLTPAFRTRCTSLEVRLFGLQAVLLLVLASAGAQDDPSGSQRIAAYRAEAAKSEDPEAVWIRAAADPGEAVKIEAARELLQLGTEKALPALRSLASGKPRIMDRGGPIYNYNDVARYAMNRIEAEALWNALVKECPEIPDRVKRAIELLKQHSSNLKFVARVRQLLIQSGSPEAIEALLQMPVDSETAAALAGRVKQDRRIVEGMLTRVRLLDEAVPRTREGALQRYHQVYGALRFFTAMGDVRFVPELLRALDIPPSVDTDGHLMMEATEAIVTCGSEALPLLEKFYPEAKSLHARENTIIAVARIGGKDAVRFLREALVKEEARPEKERLTHAIKAHLERLKEKE